MALLGDLEKPVKPKRPPKTLKEKKFVQAYLETGNATKAALKAYNTNPVSARQIGSETLAKLDMNFYFQKAGLTNEVLAQAITVKALTAKKRDQFSGEYDEDHAVQLQALKLASQLMGLIKAGETLVQNNTQNNITVTPILSGTSHDVLSNDGNPQAS